MDTRIDTGLRAPRKRRRVPFKWAMAFLFFLGLTLIVMVPFICIVIGSFRPGSDIVTYGLSLKPDISRFTLDCYKYVFSGDNYYFTWFFNSVLITVIQTLGTLAITSFVAYGFAMYQFRGKNILFALVLFTMMIPFEIILLPLYKLIVNLKMINTYAGIIVPFLANPLAIFFFRQYLSGISHDFMDAARVDGCTEYGIFVKVIAPLMLPSYAAVGIFVGMNAWNGVLWPMIVVNSNSKITLPVGLSSLMTPYGNNYDLLIAGSVCSVIPIFILYMFFQKYFIAGLTVGGVKG